MDKDREEFQHDWYGILGLEPGSSKEAVEKAARKLAAKNHPDKTSDPEAPAKFLLIQKAKEILIDDAKRKTIDDHHKQSRKRKEYEENRWKDADEQRKRFRDNLNERISKEQESRSAVDPNEVLRQELLKQTKIMEEMRRQNKELMERSTEQAKQRSAKKEEDYLAYRQALAKDTALKSRQIKFKWKRGAETPSEDSLYQLLKVHGAIDEVTFVGSKGTTALITFATAEGARKVVDHYATSEDYRVSYLSDDKMAPKAAVFTHQYTPTPSINEDLAKKLDRFRQEAAEAKRPTAKIVMEELLDSTGKVDLDQFLAKKTQVLSMLRNVTQPNVQM